MIRIKNLGIAIVTTTALAAATAGAEYRNGAYYDNGRSYDVYSGEYSYVKTDTYAGNTCKRFDGATGESNYGTYSNSNYDASWVHCPIVSHNNPYEKKVYVDVQAYDPNPDYNIECNVREFTPSTDSGWSLQQGSSKSTSGRNSRARQLSLEGPSRDQGFAPASHVYVQCVLPGGYDDDYAAVYSYASHYQTKN